MSGFVGIVSADDPPRALAINADGSINATLPAGTVDIGAVNPQPSATAANAPTNSTVSAYAASKVIKASAGNLFGITGYNSKTSAQFIQLHDAAALPSEAAVPVVVFTVPASSNFFYDPGIYGRKFATGIVVCNSSTAQTKTIGSADCWFDAQYV